MEITLNGEPRETSESLSLAQAVALLTDAESGVAAAVNGDVISRTVWDAMQLSDGDQVEVLTAVQGG